MFLRLTTLVSLLVAMMAILPLDQAQAATKERCFPATGLCVKGRILRFWEDNGGLAVFGLPITSQRKETIEGQMLQVQWFERTRMELHPENPAPYDVLLGRLGSDRLAQQGRDWTTFPQSSEQSGCRFFGETGHNVCGDILAAWHATGLELDGRRGKTDVESLALWGLPLSDPMTETLSDGKTYTVQWFERGRFELHPENRPPHQVLFGLLGREIGPSPSPAPEQDKEPTPKPEPRPAPQPDSQDACNAKRLPKITDGAQAWMTVPQPARPSTTRLCVRLMVDTKPVAGAPASAALHYKQRVAQRGPVQTDADGIASMVLEIGEGASTSAVDIDVWVTYQGHTYTAKTSFTPQ